MYLPSNNPPANQRFTKVFRKINSSYQDRASVTHLPQSSTDNSMYGEKSVGYSEDRELKLVMPMKTKLQQHQRTTLPVDQQGVMNVLFKQRQVQVNRQRKSLRTQFIPTSNGLKYILRISQTFYLNLSWLHSVQQLQKSKLLVLYYDMYHLSSQSTKSRLPKIESLIIQFLNQKEMMSMLGAISFVHARYHDEDVEKLYHLLCGGERKGK